MKSLAFLIGVTFAFLTACTAQEQRSRGSATATAPSAQTQQPQQRQQCRAADVYACTAARGGISCFSRCGERPSDKFCRMAPLTKCIESDGGNSCYATHCSAKAFSGPFSPPPGEKLERIPESGYGFETYGDLDMRHGKPRTIARVKELALRVYNKTGYKIYVGNLSNEYGGNNGKHVGHIGGVEVDLAVMGNTPLVKCFNIWESCYLRGASMVLADEVRKMGGATLIYFNDSHVQNRFPNFVYHAGGHDDHYHIRWFQE